MEANASWPCVPGIAGVTRVMSFMLPPSHAAIGLQQPSSKATCRAASIALVDSVQAEPGAVVFGRRMQPLSATLERMMAGKGAATVEEVRAVRNEDIVLD